MAVFPLVVALWLSAPLNPPAPPNPEASTFLTVPKIENPPTLDDFIGMEPSAEIASSLVLATGFTQREPQDGQPCSQKTNVYLAHDDKFLYAIFVAFDREPERIRATMAPREQVENDDTVHMMIDTFDDQRRAYVFQCNPRGVQWDGVWSEDGSFDSSYDTVWSSSARITSGGFMVKMAIPFKSLRFPSGSDQRWGIMFNRTILRTNEDVYWPRFSNRVQGRLNQAGKILIRNDLSVGRNYQIIPFSSFGSYELLDPYQAAYIDDDNDTDLGVDAKFVFKDSFVLDIAANPDFSQIEADDPEVTVNRRFEIFFPERRPFFLENADIFSTPLNMVFTRRIENPRAGMRLTGKSGAYAFGALVADDERNVLLTPDREPEAGFGVFRMSRDIMKQSKIGVLYTGRESEGRYNHVGSLDARFTLDDNWNLALQAVASRTDRVRRQVPGSIGPEDREFRADGGAYTVVLNREGRLFTSHIHYTEVDEDFETQTGFLGSMERPGTTNFHSFSSWRRRPEGRNLVAWGPNLFLNRTWDEENTRLDENITPTMVFEFRGQTVVQFNRSWQKERFRPQDIGNTNLALECFAGDCHNLDLEPYNYRLIFRSGYFKTLDVDFTFDWGEGINNRPARDPVDPRLFGLPHLAERINGELSFSYRPLPQLRIDHSYLFTQLNDLDTEDLIFGINIYRTRLNWQFNREFSMRLIASYESLHADESRTSLVRLRGLTGDLLLTYKLNPWSAIYVGYNDSYSNVGILETEFGNVLNIFGEDLQKNSRQFFIKASYMLR